MPRTELIDQLIRDGKVVAYYDYRKNSLADLGGVSANTTIGNAANVSRNGRGYSVTGNGHLAIANNATLQATINGTLLWWGNFCYVLLARLWSKQAALFRR